VTDQEGASEIQQRKPVAVGVPGLRKAPCAALFEVALRSLFEVALRSLPGNAST
jgi:hypothetical protein